MKATISLVNFFCGSDGWLSLDLKCFQIYKGEDRKLIREMKYTEAAESDTLPGRESATLSLMANISYRTGRKLRFDPVTERFIGDDEVSQLVSRRYREPFVVPEKV
jgi:Oxidoreductase family, C-terminal alpha/beta domain